MQRFRMKLLAQHSRGGLLPPLRSLLALLAVVMLSYTLEAAEPSEKPQGQIIEQRILPGGATLVAYQQPIDEAQVEPRPVRTAQVQPLPAPTPQRIEIVRPELQPTTPQPPVMFGPGMQRLPLLGEPEVPGSTPAASPQTKSKYAQFVDPAMIAPEDTLMLIEGRTYILKFKQAPRRYQVDDTVVAADLITDRELSLTGQASGQQQQSSPQGGNRGGGSLARSAVLNLWFDDPNAPDRQSVLSYLIKVVPDPDTKLRNEQVYNALADEINRVFPNSNVKLTLVGNRVAVRGEAKDIVEAAQILQIVMANAPNNTNVEALNVGSLNVVVNPTAIGGATLDGQPAINTPGEAQGLLEQLAQRSTNVINLLHVSGEQQVMLRVTLAEVSRTAARAIGVNFSVQGNSGLSFASLGASTPLPFPLPTSNTPIMDNNGNVVGFIPTQNPIPLGSAGGNFNVRRGDFQLAVNALNSMGLARTLAEPNLVALNGQVATFRAGTEVAVTNNTVTQGAVLNNFAQVFAGITLNFTPYITDRDRVRLRMVAQVGAVSSTNAAGQPNITQRTVQTTVDLRDGQTLAVAGLLLTNYTNASAGIPFAKDLPIIGQLFKQDTTNTTENELMIIVTPELVHPLECDEKPPLPGSDVFEPSDVEFFVTGRLESRRSEDYRDGARTTWDRMRAYRWCEQKYIIGPHGHSDGKY